MFTETFLIFYNKSSPVIATAEFVSAQSYSLCLENFNFVTKSRVRVIVTAEFVSAQKL